MSKESQKTFGAEVGMNPTVPVKRFPTITSVLLDNADEPVFEDCNGVVHDNEEDAFDENVDAVESLLDSIAAEVYDYETSTDYLDEYSYIACEPNSYHDDAIERWIEDDYTDPFGVRGRFGKSVREALASEVADLYDHSDIETQYEGSDYRAYYGRGCCVDSYQLNETEITVDPADYPILAFLDSRGELNDVLAKADPNECNVCSGRHSLAGRSEIVGRHGFELNVWLSGQAQFVISEDRMHELVVEAIIATCRKTDKRK